MRKQNDYREQLKAIDFFCGSGGMSYGLSQAGIKILAGIDIDEECKDTYKQNNPHSKFIRADIKKLTEAQLQNKTGVQKHDDSVVFIGCSPCQYWTRINTQKTKSLETKNLLEEFRRFIDFFRPGFIVIENVPGLANKKEESNLPDFLNFLETNNYTFTHKVINSNHYGVPQNRKRFVLIGSRVIENIPFPEPKK
ncbi:MAG: DNA cytosine methyltransferase, partial [bacterium]|nr:DNA cytosine methyltransferase [bacterium]